MSPHMTAKTLARRAVQAVGCVVLGYGLHIGYAVAKDATVTREEAYLPGGLVVLALLLIAPQSILVPLRALVTTLVGAFRAPPPPPESPDA